MSNQRRMQGVLPVFQTPFHDDESIDWATLDRELAWLFDQGADGIVMAMVSETLRLATDEREALAVFACRAARARGTVTISVGAESGHSSERFARHAQDCGADAVMAIPPVSVAVGEDELFKYYTRLIQAVQIPVIVQDASGYVGRPMSIAMQARLFEQFGPRVMYKPEAAPLGPRLTLLREATGAGAALGGASIFEGSGGIALVESYRRGVEGTMPAADLIDVLVALWKALQAGDQDRINHIALPLCAMIALQVGLDGFLAVEKYVLKRRGIFGNTAVRGPVGYVLDEGTKAEVDRLLDLLLEAVGKPIVTGPTIA